MTKFEDIKLIYNQFLNLSAEIKEMINEQDYDGANYKMQHSNKLINRIIAVKKTAVLDENEQQELNKIEKKIVEDNKNLIKKLIDEKTAVGDELKEINKKIKINSAYDISAEEQQGGLIDYSE